MTRAKAAEKRAMVAEGSAESALSLPEAMFSRNSQALCIKASTGDAVRS